MKKRKFSIYAQTNKSGSTTWILYLGTVDGKRERKSFKSKAEATTWALQWDIQRKNQGLEAFTLPLDKRTDATKALSLLGTDISLVDAARYYCQHVLAYKNAPTVSEAVKKYVADGERIGNRDRTIKDKKNRLTKFAEDFGDRRLADIATEELKDWVYNEEWAPVTKINYYGKISQLYNYAVRLEWVDSNTMEKVDCPQKQEATPEVFTVAECQALLQHANEFGLLPYISLGLFAGIRSAELLRLDGSALNFNAKIIRIGSSIAKLKATRTIEMLPALLAWLPQFTGPVVKDRFTLRLADLRETAGVKWKNNGLRHSFASYHYEKFESAEKTSKQMGNSPDIVHKHYKALVAKDDTENFWNLRPSTENKVVPMNAVA